jgi:hypothetical protein
MLPPITQEDAQNPPVLFPKQLHASVAVADCMHD